jgi:hypothetical protein
MSATIIRGEDRHIIFSFKKADGTAYDLSNVTEVEARIPKSDGSVLSKKLSLSQIQILSPATDGQLSVIVTDADTALLKMGSRDPIQLTVDQGSARRIFNIRNQISVEDPAVP